MSFPCGSAGKESACNAEDLGSGGDLPPEKSMSETESRSVMSNSLQPHGLYSSPGQNTGVGSRPLLQGIFPTQGSNPGLLPCRQILYQLSHQGSPDIDMIYNSEAAPSPSSKVLEGHLKEMMSELSQRLSRCEPSQGKSRTNSTITEF